MKGEFPPPPTTEFAKIIHLSNAIAEFDRDLIEDEV